MVTENSIKAEVMPPYMDRVRGATLISKENQCGVNVKSVTMEQQIHVSHVSQ